MSPKLDKSVPVVSSTATSDYAGLATRGDHHAFGQRGLLGELAETQVTPKVGEEELTLVRTLIGIFEDEAQARFAASCLKSLSHLDLHSLKVVAPHALDETELVAVRHQLGEKYWEEVKQAVDRDFAVLIVSVDETVIYHATCILDEDAGSVRTIVLPPEARTW